MWFKGLPKVMDSLGFRMRGTSAIVVSNHLSFTNMDSKGPEMLSSSCMVTEPVELPGRPKLPRQNGMYRGGAVLPTS